MSKWKALQWLTYTALGALVAGTFRVISVDLDKASPPEKWLVQPLRSHYRLSLVLLGIILLLLVCSWLYASRRDGLQNIVRCEHVQLFISSKKLHAHHFDIANPNPYYMEHPEVPQARASLAQRGRLLILGRPSAGKTRLAFQLAKATKKTWVLRLRPEFTKFDLLNFPAIPMPCRVLCFFDDADKFLGKLDLGRVERVLDEQCNLQIIVTCRSGAELEQVRSSKEMAAFLDTLNKVECTDFSEEELLALARHVGKPEDAALYDRTPGSVVLELAAMSNRLRAAPQDAQLVMKAMFLLRSAFIYRPEPKLVAAVVNDVYQANLTENAFEAAVRGLGRDGFLLLNPRLRPCHDTYLTRSFLPYYPENSARFEDDLERLGSVVESAGTPRDVQSVGTLWQSRKSFDRAIFYLERAALKITDDEVLFFDLAFCQAQVGQMDPAIANWRNSLQISPNDPVTLYNLGTALAGKGLLDEAIANYHKSLEFSPNDPATLNNLGIALKAKGLLDEAIASFHKSLEFRPNDPATLYNLGNALKAKGLLDEAIASYRKSLEFSPNDPDTLYNLGTVLQAKGLLNEAIANYRKSLEFSPNDPATLYNLGTVLQAKGLLDEAIASFRKSLEFSPNDPYTLNYLGIALKAKGLLDEAIASYRKSLEFSPNHPDTLNYLGIALAAKGSLDEAISSYRKSLELRPNHAATTNNLRLALEQKARSEGAKEKS